MRDMRIALRVGGGALIGVLFFLIVVVLMPFAIGPDLALLARIGPAILWLGALLASLLTLDRLFTADHEDGSLDLLINGPHAAGTGRRGEGAGALADAGLPLVLAPRCLGCFSISNCAPTGAVALTLARRHAGADLHRPDWSCAGGDVASRRTAAGGAGFAADDSGADLRRRRGQCRDHRRRAVRRAVSDPVRAIAVASSRALQRPLACGTDWTDADQLSGIAMPIACIRHDH